MSEWQPNETAPRGPEIDPFDVLYDVGWFHAEWPHFETWFDEWQPLPEQPRAS